MSGEFAGKVALITGAGGNLGQAVTRRFAADGAQLVLAERSTDRLALMVNGLRRDFGADVATASVDLAQPEAVDRLFHDAEARFGGVDIVVHTVGGFAMGPTVADGDVDQLDAMMALNARPVFLVGSRAARHMTARGQGGKIIFVLARASLKGTAKQAAYTASKAAAQRIMESLSAEVRDQGINVNAVLPSTIDTPPNRESMPNADFNKWVTPDDVASAIAYLASAEARALHGVSLEVYNRA